MALDGEVKAIRQAPIFNGVDPAQIRLLACMSERMLFHEGEFILQEGDASDAVYVVINGEVEIVVKTPAGERTLSQEATGAVFGEVGILCGSPCAASLRARTDVSMLQISKDNFFRLMQDNPQFSMSVAQALAERVHQVVQHAAGSPVAVQ